MFTYLKRAAQLALALAALMLAAEPAMAQTPENTVITNTATVSFTDANGNTYGPVSGFVLVTVGFKAGVSVTENTPSPTPASPSTADTLTFTITNAGNGTDSVSISENISVPGVINVTGYRHGATTWPSLADLNTELSSVAIARAGSITIKVVYDVLSNHGGVNTRYTLTAASRRTPAMLASAQSSITPAQTYAVAVSPDGGQNVQKLPGNNYSFSFTVQNDGNGSDTLDLLASSPGSAVITVVSVNGMAGDSTRITLAANTSQLIAVVYDVADVAAGSTDILTLRGRSVGQPTTLDDGFADLTVVRPSLTLTKEAYRDGGGTPILAGTVVPGEFIVYRVTITNTGTTDAKTVQVTDTLPAVVTLVSSSGSDWSISVVGQEVTAAYTAGGGVLAAGASSTFDLRVSIN